MNKKTLFVLAIFALSALGFLLGQENVFSQACIAKTHDRAFCQALEKRLFVNKMAAREISPTLVGAPELPIDPKIRFIAFHNPNYFSRFAYCYFTFRAWFDPKQLSPKQMADAANGFAIIQHELKGYSKWLYSDRGIACRKIVKDSLALDVVDLEKELENSNKAVLIAVNPAASIGAPPEFDAILKDAALTLNHERIHAIQVACPNVEIEARKYWKSLPAKDKKKLTETYAGYDWSNEIIAIREAFAFRYENHPEQVLRFAKQCDFPRSFDVHSN